MGKFRSYGLKADRIAREAFEKINKAEATVKNAENMVKKYPERHGWVDGEYAAKSARFKADFLEAQAKLKVAQGEMVEAGKRIAGVRAELAEAVNAEFSAKASEVDAATMELLRSGVLQVDEYDRLMSDYERAGNKTMTRIVGKYAAELAEVEVKKLGGEDRARQLRTIAYKGERDTGDGVMGLFDVIQEVFARATDNHHMIPHWDELTHRSLEAM